MPETARANVLEADGAVCGLVGAGDPFGLLSALSKQVQSDRTRPADPAEVRHADQAQNHRTAAKVIPAGRPSTHSSLNLRPVPCFQ
jgi:hypothetical protein